MVPLGSVVNLEHTTGPYRVLRYNLYPAAEIQGDGSPDARQGRRVLTMERLAAERLPPGYGYEWTELAYQEKLAGNTGIMVFGMAVVVVFLLLAALYESVTLPFAVVLIVPMCLLAAILGVNLRGADNNILTQIGLVVLIALAAKNAILIVEFARQGEEDHGLERHEAASEAGRTRLRPILMTSFAFILGVTPLAFASGAGAEMRQALGVAVFAGMIGVTVFDFFHAKVFCMVSAASRRGCRNHRRNGRRCRPPAGRRTTRRRQRHEPRPSPSCADRRPGARRMRCRAALCEASQRRAGAAQPFVSIAPDVADARPLPPDWWRLYDDPVLDRLVPEALAENADLKTAAANLAYAQGLLDEARAGLFPTTDVSAGATYGTRSAAQLLSAVTGAPVQPQWVWYELAAASGVDPVRPHPTRHRGRARQRGRGRRRRERGARHRRGRDGEAYRQCRPARRTRH